MDAETPPIDTALTHCAKRAKWALILSGESSQIDSDGDGNQSRSFDFCLDNYSKALTSTFMKRQLYSQRLMITRSGPSF